MTTEASKHPTPWTVRDFQGFGWNGKNDEAVIVDAEGFDLWMAEPAEAQGMDRATAEFIVRVVNEVASGR